MTPLEPERYELLAGPAYNFPLDRRGFFKSLGGGIVVASLIAHAQESGGGRRGGQSAPEKSARGCISATMERSRLTPEKSRSGRMRAPR